MGTAMSAVGANPLYARSIGIRVSRMRVRATMISTVLAAMGLTLSDAVRMMMIRVAIPLLPPREHLPVKLMV